MSITNSQHIITSYFENQKNIKDELRADFKKLKSKPPKDLDSQMQSLHIEWFEKIDCLDCANCCSTLSPAVKDVDITRLAKHLRLKPSKIVEQYFIIDNDGDYVFKESPCPFLMPDKYCSVYDARPRACREYPHTDRRRAAQLLSITQKNCETCPAVYNIVKELKY